LYVVNNGSDTISKIDLCDPDNFEAKWFDQKDTSDPPISILRKPFGIAIYGDKAYVTN